MLGISEMRDEKRSYKQAIYIKKQIVLWYFEFPIYT